MNTGGNKQTDGQTQTDKGMYTDRQQSELISFILFFEDKVG
jgi:hypothetical protein